MTTFMILPPIHDHGNDPEGARVCVDVRYLVTPNLDVEPCGCCVKVGRRRDTQDPVGGMEACEEHAGLGERFQDLVRWSLQDGGSDENLLDVMQALLDDLLAGRLG